MTIKKYSNGSKVAIRLTVRIVVSLSIGCAWFTQNWRECKRDQFERASTRTHTHSRTYKSWDSTVAPLILFSTRAYYLCDNAWKLLHLNKFQCDALQLYLLPLAVRRIFSSFTSWIHKCWEFIVHWVCVCVRSMFASSFMKFILAFNCPHSDCQEKRCSPDVSCCKMVLIENE